MATRFAAHDDPFNPHPALACMNRDLDDEKDLFVAHRTLPCGTPIAVCVPRTGRCVSARVMDRGPYGRTRGGDYRVTLDLSPAVSRRLKHNGYETVIYGVIR